MENREKVWCLLEGCGREERRPTAGAGGSIMYKSKRVRFFVLHAFCSTQKRDLIFDNKNETFFQAKDEKREYFGVKVSSYTYEGVRWRDAKIILNWKSIEAPNEVDSTIARRRRGRTITEEQEHDDDNRVFEWPIVVIQSSVTPSATHPTTHCVGVEDHSSVLTGSLL